MRKQPKPTVQILRCSWVVFFFSVLFGVAHALPRLEVNGPVLTLTLKEPSNAEADAVNGRPWITDVAAVKPKATWSLRTNPTPFPRLLPALKQLRTDVGYEYHRCRQAPSSIETTARFSTAQGDLVVQPSYDVPNRKQTLLVQASRGASYVLAKFGGNPTGSGAGKRMTSTLVNLIKGSFLLHLPYATVSAVRLTPSFDFAKRDLSCTVEAVTGGPARTKAVLNLDYYNPTLTVVHALDERNTIAPEINLYNAKIVYQWDLLLGAAGSSLRTKVDPVTAIHVRGLCVLDFSSFICKLIALAINTRDSFYTAMCFFRLQVTWTDVSAAGGTWVTDVRLRKYK